MQQPQTDSTLVHSQQDEAATEPQAILRKDRISGLHWLEFLVEPEQAMRDALKTAGWRWGYYRKQYYTNRRFPQFPALSYRHGGACEYAAERSGRLAAYSDNAEERSEDYAERSDEVAGSLNGVAVQGMRGNRQEKALKQAERLKDHAETEAEKATYYDRKSRSSASHQQYKFNPGVIARRIKRLRADITKIRNQYIQSVIYGASSLKYFKETHQDEIEIEEKKEVLHASLMQQKAGGDAKIAMLEVEIAENEALLQERGGLPIDRETVEVGDIVEWRGEEYEVVKINKATIRLKSPYRTGWWGREHNEDKTEIRGVLRKKDGMILRELVRRSSAHPSNATDQLQREYAVDSVATVNIGRQENTEFFPINLQEQENESCWQMLKHLSSVFHEVIVPTISVTTRLVVDMWQSLKEWAITLSDEDALSLTVALYPHTETLYSLLGPKRTRRLMRLARRRYLIPRLRSQCRFRKEG